MRTSKTAKAAGLVAIGAAAIGAAAIVAQPSAARAALVYSYAEQTISNVQITGAGLGTLTLSALSGSNSATLGGSGVSTSGTNDAPEAYQGAPPPAPENSFVKYSTAGGGPQSGNFARGDSLVGAAASAVAETATASPLSLDTASSDWIFASTFTSTGSSVSISLDYSNDILAQTSDPGATAQASFTMNFTVQDQHGHTSRAAPVELNASLSSPLNSPELIGSGSLSIPLSLANLTSGDTYTVTIAGHAFSSALASAVPEPMSLGAVAGAMSLTIRRPSRRGSRSILKRTW